MIEAGQFLTQRFALCHDKEPMQLLCKRIKKERDLADHGHGLVSLTHFGALWASIQHMSMGVQVRFHHPYDVLGRILGSLRLGIGKGFARDSGKRQPIGIPGSNIELIEERGMLVAPQLTVVISTTARSGV